ncbi:8812_t:CDS:2 [Funneliformis mosseae]|uniref:8812_t:CDS:1 n=1 Tax=Funneliformis mosseae TaxID=27381 RepID=A0A9N9BER6_FUNMO|nr:8812_t:CDS:2 [Funneliformis mosseae]
MKNLICYTYSSYRDWIHIYKENNKNLTYSKAVNTLVKSLRKIANKSSNSAKIQKAKNLLNVNICPYMENVLCNNLLDNCGCSQQEKHNF